VLFGEERRPEVLGMKNVGIAFALHVGAFLLFLLYATLHGLFETKETVIPIDLTVVVNENLDGEENEPPPLNNDTPPEPEPEPPKPEPVPEPKVEKVEALEQVQEKPKEPEKKIEKPKEPEKPREPQKTKEELLRERLEKMRKDAKFVKRKVSIEVKEVPSGNGRTERKTLTDAQIRDLLNKGYKPGASTQLAANEMQLCLSLIKQAFYDRWDRPPWTESLRPMVVRVWFGAGGRVISYKLESGSGDGRADATIMRAARLVGSVPGLTPDFLSKYRTSGIPVRFTVTPQ